MTEKLRDNLKNQWKQSYRTLKTFIDFAKLIGKLKSQKNEMERRKVDKRKMKLKDWEMEKCEKT